MGLSLASGVMQASQMSAIGKANAAMATAEAQQIEEIGRFNEQRARDRMGRLIARQRGQLLARGVRLDSASAQTLGEEAATERSIEASAQRFNTASRATSKRNEAAIHSYRGSMGAMTGLFSTAANGLSASLDLWPELTG